MKRKTRRIIFYIFLIIFLILVPLITLFSRGYTFDFEKKTIIRNGGIYLRSTPQKAEIYIDNKLKGKTNKFIKRLLPKIYEIKVEIDDYHIWEKNLTVKPGIVTKVDTIFLIQKNPKISLNTEKRIDSFSILPNKKEIAYLSSNLFYIKSQDKDEIITTFKLNLPIKWIWSSNNENVILESNNQFYFLNINDPKVLINLNALVQNSNIYEMENVSFGLGGKRIYFTSKNNLYYLELNESIRDSIVSDILVENVSNYIAYKHGIIYQENINEKIYELDLTSFKSAEFFNQVFPGFDQGKWILSNDKKKLLSQKEKTIEILWLDEVFNNSINREKGDTQEIDLKEKINQVIWLPHTDEHLIISTENDILITELDNRLPQNTISFIKTENSDIQYNIKNKTLYFLEKQKLYEAKI